jgi:hypothetical protein
MAQPTAPFRVATKHPHPEQRAARPDLTSLDSDTRQLIIKQAKAIKDAFFDGGSDPLALTLLFVLKDFDVRVAETAAISFLEERGFLFLQE